jgi:hypothetical protein
MQNTLSVKKDTPCQVQGNVHISLFHVIGSNAVFWVFATNQAQVNFTLGACPKAISSRTESAPSLLLLTHWQVANIVITDVELWARLYPMFLGSWWDLQRWTTTKYLHLAHQGGSGLNLKFLHLKWFVILEGLRFPAVQEPGICHRHR